VQIAPEARRANDERNKEYSVHIVGPELNMLPRRTEPRRSNFYNGREIAIVGKITGNFLSTFHLSLLGSLPSLCKWRHLAVKVGTYKEQGSTISLQPAVHPGH
jgi:hypothetical protein